MRIVGDDSLQGFISFSFVFLFLLIYAIHVFILSLFYFYIIFFLFFLLLYFFHSHKHRVKRFMAMNHQQSPQQRCSHRRSNRPIFHSQEIAGSPRCKNTMSRKLLPFNTRTLTFGRHIGHNNLRLTYWEEEKLNQPWSTYPEPLI